MNTQQHWNNFDRLMAHMTSLQEFHYGNPELDGKPGCLACQLGASCGIQADDESVYGRPVYRHMVFQEHLGVTEREAMFLYGCWADSVSNAFHLTGEVGIKEALRRLAVVAAKYQRPAPQVRERGGATASDVGHSPQGFGFRVHDSLSPAEAQFLQSVRALGAKTEVEN